MQVKGSRVSLPALCRQLLAELLRTRDSDVEASVESASRFIQRQALTDTRVGGRRGARKVVIWTGGTQPPLSCHLISGFHVSHLPQKMFAFPIARAALGGKIRFQWLLKSSQKEKKKKFPSQDRWLKLFRSHGSSDKADLFWSPPRAQRRITAEVPEQQ